MSSFISLGGNCAVAYQLQQRNYTNRYPFDWCNITILQLNKVLSNNFQDFDNIQIHKLSKNHLNFKSLENESYILKNIYNIKFAHEISNKYILDDFKIILKKRINKFYNLNNPIFIRLEINNISNEYFEKQYKELYKNLSKYFITFKLIVITKNKPFKSEIQFIKLIDFQQDWKYLNVEWDKILK